MTGPLAAIATQMYDVFDFKSAAAGKLDHVFERFAVPDLEIEPPPLYPDMKVYRGIAEIRGFYAMLTEVWEEWTFEPGEMEEAGDRLLVHVRLNARGRGSGLELVNDAFHVWTFRDGKIARIKTVLDESEARRTAGLGDLQSPR